MMDVFPMPAGPMIRPELRAAETASSASKQTDRYWLRPLLVNRNILMDRGGMLFDQVKRVGIGPANVRSFVIRCVGDGDATGDKIASRVGDIQSLKLQSVRKLFRAASY